MIKQLGKCTHEEKEILNILLEECAEVIQAISKIFRFGFESCHPEHPIITNRVHLTEELGDLYCMMNLLSQRGVVPSDEVIRYSEMKLAKLKKYSNINLEVVDGNAL